MRMRIALLLVLLVAAAPLTSCVNKPQKPADPLATSAGTPSADRASEVRIPPPPGLEAKLIEPRRGEALQQAQLKLAQVVARLPWPAYLAEVHTAATRPATSQPAAAPVPNKAEPPLAAQHAYVEGRQAWLERRAFDAVRNLQTADTLAPDRPEILRLLGQIYTLTGNKVRGGYYLEQAVKLDPRDVESLFLLGRFALEQGKWDAAIVTFGYILSLTPRADNVDAALWPLIAFSLAGALDHEGFDAAAIEHYAICLALPENFGRTTRLGREVMFLSRQRGLIWQAVGDAQSRMNHPAAALEAYRRAAQSPEKDEAGLVRRMAYVQLRLGNREAAQESIIAYLGSSQASLASLELVKYLAANGVDRNRLVARIQKIYESTGRSPQLVIAMSSLLSGAQGRAILAGHIAAKPTDRTVFEQLVKQSFAEVPPASVNVTEALQAALAAVTAKPELAQSYAGILVEAAGDQEVLLAALEAIPADAKRQPIVSYVKARSLLKAGRMDAAIKAFEQAAAGEQALPAARVDQAKLLLMRGQTAAAAKLLETMADRSDTEVVGLRLRLLADTGKAAEALKLVDELLAKQPMNVELVIQKARLQQITNDAVGAERTLLDLLDARPQAEEIYAELFRLYDSPQGPPDALPQYQRLMMRMLRTIPQSRIARLKNSEFLEAGRQFDQAEQMARGLLQENPRDFEALDRLLSVLVSANHKDAAEALLRKYLTDTPKDIALLRVAYTHYHERVRDERRADEIAEVVLLAQPSSESRAIELAKLYERTKRPELGIKILSDTMAGKVDQPWALVHLLVRLLAASGKPEQAELQIRQAIERFPDQKADLTYEFSLLYDRLGQKDRAEKVLTDMLREFPDHAMACNGLGYSWADRGVNLPEALKLIDKALAGDANNAAYLDSKGWVLYKIGRFAEAVQWLERARAAQGGEYPVILEHLGDALYRNKNSTEAVNAWTQSQQLLSQVDVEDDHELVGLGDRLKQKIEAVQQGRAAIVADVPGKPQVKPRAPVAAPLGRPAAQP